jgi:chloramphenicol 3-O phosphotransferase
MANMASTNRGSIIVLNGAPRSGKSSIVEAIQDSFEGAWMNIGVDVYVRHVTPPSLRPGIGLRPGGERPDLEDWIPAMYAALYESAADHCRLGLNVVMDVGHHDSYSEPRGILLDCARRLAGLPAWIVGVRCPIETILERRSNDQAGREGTYVKPSKDDPVPLPVLRWQEEAHKPGIYDLEVDTSQLSPAECAKAIRRMIRSGPESARAFPTLAAMERR